MTDQRQLTKAQKNLLKKMQVGTPYVAAELGVPNTALMALYTKGAISKSGETAWVRNKNFGD